MKIPGPLDDPFKTTVTLVIIVVFLAAMPAFVAFVDKLDQASVGVQDKPTEAEIQDILKRAGKLL